MKRLARGLIVAHEVQLFGARVGLGAGGRGLDLLPGCLGVVGVVSADVCASKLINYPHTAPSRTPNFVFELTRCSTLCGGKLLGESNTFQGDGWVLRVNGEIRASAATAPGSRRVGHFALSIFAFG